VYLAASVAGIGKLSHMPTLASFFFEVECGIRHETVLLYQSVHHIKIF